MIYFLIALLIVIPLILLPFLYALTGVTFVPLGCWLYNPCVRSVGGLQVSVTDDAGA